MKKVLNYLKEMFEFEAPDEDIGKKPWFNSFILLIAHYLILVVVLVLDKPPDLNVFSGFLLVVSLICGIRGVIGLLLYTLPFVKSFFPYTVTGVWYMFTHVTPSFDGSTVRYEYSGQRVYWSKRFLTRKKAENFINENSSNLRQMMNESKGKNLFVWDNSID